MRRSGHSWLIGFGALVFTVVGGDLIWASSPVADFTNDDCLDCHDPSDDEPGMQAPIGAVAESVHGFVECLDCHPGADREDHIDGNLVPECAGCHESTVGELEKSVHGRGGGAAQWASGGCQVCHGPTHTLLAGDHPDCPVHSVRIAETCGHCHADPTLASELGIRLVQPLAAYTASVHARAVAEGGEGALCTSCHGAHDILPAADPQSHVHRSHLVEACATCHAEVSVQFAASVHGKAAAHGVQAAPVCTDCHGEHRILNPHDRNSPVYATNIPKLTCGRCHGDLRLSDKFGMESDQVPAYADSFHGLASRSGSVTVANCSSCHGIHDILPSNDPAAHTHSENLASTCGACHPGAGSRFAIGPVHILPTEPEHAAVYWVRRVYLILIFVTISGMLVHNLLDLYRKSRDPQTLQVVRRRWLPERMSLGFRIAHGLLAVSFFVLAYTGFALKYPESWWAAPLLGWESQFGLRGWIHRGAAVAMLGAVAVHVIHVILDHRAWRAIAAMVPNGDDVTELRAKLSYLVGRSPVPPPDPWLGYVEKAEYLAVVWGTAIMAVTGFLLWFEDLTLRWLPTWVADVATVVHFYEAILATAAIVVWHFYSVIFDPAVYPMDPAWLTGRTKRTRELRRARRERRQKAQAT